jgi:hypothetical protein
MFEKREASFELSGLIGLTGADARRKCEDDGFIVRLLDLAKHHATTLDHNAGRLRLMTRQGIVREVRRG